MRVNNALVRTTGGLLPLFSALLPLFLQGREGVAGAPPTGLTPLCPKRLAIWFPSEIVTLPQTHIGTQTFTDAHTHARTHTHTHTHGRTHARARARTYTHTLTHSLTHSHSQSLTVSGIQRTLTIYITSCAVASVAAEQRSCIETQKRKQEIWFCDDAPFGHDRAFSDSLWPPSQSGPPAPSAPTSAPVGRPLKTLLSIKKRYWRMSVVRQRDGDGDRSNI